MRPFARSVVLFAVVALLATAAAAQDQSATAPAPATDGPWTVVHIGAPAGTSLCVTGQRVPEGVFDFRVGAAVYTITAFGPGRPRTVTMLDAEAAPPQLTLDLPVPPALAGAWGGTMSGEVAYLDIVAGPCDQPGCEVDDARPEGLSGTLRGSVDGIAGTWTLRHFDWVADKNVFACSAVGAAGNRANTWEAVAPDLSLWLVLDERGTLRGTIMTDADLDNAELWSETGEAEMDATGALANPVDDAGEPVDRRAAFIRGEQ